MRKVLLLFALSVWVLAFVGSTNHKSSESSSYTTQEDSLQQDRDKYVKLVMESIKGKEDMRADSVFKNIKMLKVPAKRLVAIMNFGYSRSLGVSCGHCHNTDDFASEEKKEKEIARGMAAMLGKINGELWKSIEGLDEKAIVNCTTCHRGHTKPALRLE